MFKTKKSNTKIETKSALFIILCFLAAAILNVISQILLARHFDKADYGMLVWSWSVLTTLAVIVEFGLGGYWNQQFGKDGWRARRLIKKTLLLFLTRLFIVLLVVTTVAALYKTNNKTLSIITLLMLPVLSMQAVMPMALARRQLEHNSLLIGLFKTLATLPRLLTAFLVVYYCSTFGIVTTSGIIGLLALLVSVISFLSLPAMCRGKISLYGHGVFVKSETNNTNPCGYQKIIKASFPFGISNLSAIMIVMGTTIISGLVLDFDAAATISVSYSVILFTFIIPTALLFNFLIARLARWTHHNTEKSLTVFRFIVPTMFLAGCVIALLVAVFGGKVLVLMFGEKYRESGELLAWFSICIPFRYLTASFAAFLIKQDAITHRAFLHLLSALTLIVTCFLLGSLFGVFGIVLSVLIAEAVMATLFLYAVCKKVFGTAALVGWNLDYKNLLKKH